MVSLSSGVYQEVLDGSASFEVHFNAMFHADVPAALTHSLNIGHHYVGLVVVEDCVVPADIGILVGSVGFLLFMLALFKAHTGYLHLLSVSLR